MSYISPTMFNPPDPKSKQVWCPFCDWRQPDTLVARKRMGLHVANTHPKEVLFQKGMEPNDLEPTGEKI